MKTMVLEFTGFDLGFEGLDGYNTFGTISLDLNRTQLDAKTGLEVLELFNDAINAKMEVAIKSRLETMVQREKVISEILEHMYRSDKLDLLVNGTVEVEEQGINEAIDHCDLYLTFHVDTKLISIAPLFSKEEVEGAEMGTKYEYTIDQLHCTTDREYELFRGGFFECEEKEAIEAARAPYLYHDTLKLTEGTTRSGKPMDLFRLEYNPGFVELIGTYPEIEDISLSQVSALKKLTNGVVIMTLNKAKESLEYVWLEPISI